MKIFELVKKKVESMNNTQLKLWKLEIWKKLLEILEGEFYML